MPRSLTFVRDDKCHRFALKTRVPWAGYHGMKSVVARAQAQKAQKACSCQRDAE